MRSLLSCPKFANVTALLALVVATAGTSYAAVNLPKHSVGTPQLKKNAVVSKKIKDRSLLAKDFRAGQLPKGEQGPPGLPGVKGADGTAVAYTRVSGAGVVDPALSKGIAQSNLSVGPMFGFGRYCFDGLAFTPKNEQATIDAIEGGGTPTLQAYIGQANTCPSGTDITVLTLNGALLANQAFYLLVN